MKSLLIAAADALAGGPAADLVALDLAAGSAGALPAGAVHVAVAPVEAAASAAGLARAMALAPAGIVLEGARSGRDVTLLDARLAVCEAERGLAHGGTSIIAVASAEALIEIGSFRGASARLAGLAFDPEALERELGAPDAAVSELARGMVVLAARAAGVPAFRVIRRPPA